MRFFPKTRQRIKESARKWSNIDRTIEDSRGIFAFIKNAFTIRTKKISHLNFEQKVANLKLTEKDLLKQQKSLLNMSILMLVIGILGITYLVYLLFNAYFLASFVSLVLIGVAFALSFRYHFWYLQIKLRSLNLSSSDWLNFILNKKKPKRNKIMKNRLITLLLLLFPSISFAQSGWGFAPPPTDFSVNYLGHIFGMVDGVLSGHGSQIIGNLFGVFNAGVLAIGGIILIYTIVISTLNTAQEGEFMGRKWSSIWVPVRTVMGLALLIPKASGYCILQIIIMWIVLQGIGLADKVWGAALSYLARGGVVVDYNRAQGKQQFNDHPSYGNQVIQAKAILEGLVCMEIIKFKLQEAYDAEVKDIRNLGRVPDFISSVNIMATHNSSNLPKVKLPNFSENHNYNIFNGVCGEISWNKISNETAREMLLTTSSLEDSSDLARGSVIEQISQARGVAVQQMYLGLSSTAKRIVTNLRQGDNGLPLGEISTTHIKVGSGKVDDQWMPERSVHRWISKSGADGQNKPPLLRGPELYNVANNYNTIMLPNLRLQVAFNDEHGARRTHQARTQFINRAYNEGWITAGAYYFRIAFINTTVATQRLPSDNGNLTAEHDRGGIKGVSIVNDKAKKIIIENVYVNYIIDFYRKGSDYDIALDGLTEFVPANSAIDSRRKTNYYNFIRIGNIDRQQLGIGNIQSGWADAFGWALDNSVVKVIIPVINTVVVKILNFGLSILELMTNFTVMALKFVFTNAVDSVTIGDPIIGLSNIGIGLIASGLGLWAIVGLLLFTGASAPFTGYGPAIGFFLLPVLFTLMGGMFTMGVTLSYYVPLLPFIIFAFGALAWFTAVIEAMVAGPIIALAVIHPDSQSDFFGKAEPAVNIMLNIFLRPAIMILGFFFGIIMSHVGIWFLASGMKEIIYNMVEVGSHMRHNSFVESMVDSISIEGIISNTIYNDPASKEVLNIFSKLAFGMVSAGISGVIGNIYNILLSPILFVIFITISIQIVRRSFDLIYLLPDTILRFIGGQQESYGRQYQEMMQDARSGFDSIGGKSKEITGKQGSIAKVGMFKDFGKDDSNADVEGKPKDS